MTKDSPVTFPKKGALPAKYPPDQPSRERGQAEKDYSIFSSPERSLAQIEGRSLRHENPLYGAFTLSIFVARIGGHGGEGRAVAFPGHGTVHRGPRSPERF
jgi:hypothetical protein